MDNVALELTFELDGTEAEQNNLNFTDTSIFYSYAAWYDYSGFTDLSTFKVQGEVVHLTADQSTTGCPAYSMNNDGLQDGKIVLIDDIFFAGYDAKCTLPMLAQLLANQGADLVLLTEPLCVASEFSKTYCHNLHAAMTSIEGVPTFSDDYFTNLWVHMSDWELKGPAFKIPVALISREAGHSLRKCLDGTICQASTSIVAEFAYNENFGEKKELIFVEELPYDGKLPFYLESGIATELFPVLDALNVKVSSTFSYTSINTDCKGSSYFEDCSDCMSMYCVSTDRSNGKSMLEESVLRSKLLAEMTPEVTPYLQYVYSVNENCTTAENFMECAGETFASQGLTSPVVQGFEYTGTNPAYYESYLVDFFYDPDSSWRDMLVLNGKIIYKGTTELDQHQLFLPLSLCHFLQQESARMGVQVPALDGLCPVESTEVVQSIYLAILSCSLLGSLYLFVLWMRRKPSPPTVSHKVRHMTLHGDNEVEKKTGAVTLS